MANGIWRTLAVAGLVVVGGLSASQCASMGGGGDRVGDEDRPPIIVKGGSLHLQSFKNWKQVNDQDWKPDHGKGKSADLYKVAMFGTGCTAQIYAGDSVRISYSEGTDTLTVTLGRLPVSQEYEPVVKPSKPMRREGDKKILSYGQKSTGQIDRIDVLDGTTVVGFCEKPTLAWIFPLKK